MTATCLERAVELYSRVCDNLVPVSTPEAAELTKLLENIFRSVNIALVNELAILCKRMGIDIWEVVDAAATKPYGFMPFQPGPGMGGHCLPVDPFYLAWRAREFDMSIEFIELAGKVNQQMPYYCVELIEHALNDGTKPIRGSRIGILGVSYKGGVGDMRESPALRIMRVLRERGAELVYHDPFVPSLPDLELHSVGVDEATAGADAVGVGDRPSWGRPRDHRARGLAVHRPSRRHPRHPRRKHRPPVKLSRPLARRIALAAQGFDRPRPARPPGIRQIEALVRRLGVLQLDSVNVFSRSHYMPVFSRLGPYDRGAARPARRTRRPSRCDRRLVEYWAHEASLIPIELQPLFRWRMERLDKRGVGLDRADRPRAARADRRDTRAGHRAGADPRQRHRHPAAGPRARPAVELARRQARARAPVLRRHGRGRTADQLRAPLRPRRAGAAGAVLARRPRAGGRSARAGPDRRPRRSESRPSPTSATTSDCRARRRRRGSPSWSRPASCCRLRSRAGRARLPVAGCPPAARGSTPGRCCRRSTRWSGTATAPSGCSTSSTGSRSTRRRRSGSTATTCCRSCSATRSWRGSI